MTPKEQRARRYLPAADDKVIGVVLERFGESFNVDVGGPFVATLSALAFEGAHVWPTTPAQHSKNAGCPPGQCGTRPARSLYAPRSAMRC